MVILCVFAVISSSSIVYSACTRLEQMNKTLVRRAQRPRGHIRTRVFMFRCRVSWHIQFRDKGNFMSFNKFCCQQTVFRLFL
ncbi:hypothetical protein F5890DRAFT_1490919 [Lentinula detonsa]|uniref:Secreted protein n=1 Tax=Lentinula detonsa TaxID=2804962 RepID=A0AA38Q8D9_9AGAR|nr:hypothetical protein F5890DRAFT_1490919 [Lentinula detonsa]